MITEDEGGRAKGRLLKPAHELARAVEDAISANDAVVATVVDDAYWAQTGRLQCRIGTMPLVEVTYRGLEEIHIDDQILVRKIGRGPTQRWVFVGWHWGPTGGGDGTITPTVKLDSIPPHKTTHQDGGSDEINVGGLSGDLADAQDPKAHKSSHQDGGSDEINVAGLSGELADGQTPKTHASSHQNGGSDEISVAGLSGDLADAQDPKTHASTHQNGGADEISVAGLSGVLADQQDASKIKGVDVIDTAIGDGKVLVYRTASGDLVYEAQAGGGGADEKVKVSSDDTTADYLINKLTAAGPITLTEVNPAGDEDLLIGYARGNVKWVTKSGGDYSTVTAALAAITDASATNRYAIIVGPDVGGEAVSLKSYVDIIGLGVFCTGASATPVGLLVTGSAVDVGIHNMLLATITGAENYSVNLTGGNIEFRGCRFAKSIYIQGGSHKFYDCNLVTSSGLGLNIISCTQVDIFGGEYLNSDSAGEAAIDASAGTVNIHGAQVRATGAYAGAIGLLVAGATVNVYGGSIYGYVDGIHRDSGTVNLYGGVSVVGGTDDINGTVNVYAASYDPANVTGTQTGADKDLVVGDLTVIKNPFVAHAALADSAKGFITSVAADSSQTTTSASFEDMTNGSVTVVIPAGMTADVYLAAISTAKCDTAGKVSYLQIDWNGGATVGSKGSESEGANQYVSIAVAFPVTSVAAGSYVAKLRKQTQTAGNTTTYYSPQLDVIVMPT